MATCRGMDVSAYQGPQDWAAHKREGVSFAFAKASEGLHTWDPRFATHIKGIKAAGLVAGAYHFGWPAQDAAAEAANYIGAVRPFAGRGFTHWLDLERYGDGRNYRGRTDSQIREWAHAWVAAVKTAFPGERVGVYTSGEDLARGHYPSNSDALWYPAYPGTAVDSYTEAEHAARPHPSGMSPLIWQFSSRGGDKSLAYLSAAGLREWAGDAAALPRVSLSAVVYAATHSAADERKHPSGEDDVRHVQGALVKRKRLKAGTYTPGIFDVPTKDSYATEQRAQGFHGADADGVPGKTSLTGLGKATGLFVVIA